MTKEELKGLLEYQIRCEMLLNEMKEDSLSHDYAIQNCVDGWDVIIDTIYLTYPELKDKINVGEYINFLISSVPEIKSEVAFNRMDDLFLNAELLAYLIVDYCENWDTRIWMSSKDAAEG